MASAGGNPCTFKHVCKQCNYVALQNRPSGCQSLKCEHYSPCDICGNNVRIGQSGSCKACTDAIAKEEEARASSKSPTVPSLDSFDIESIMDESDKVDIKITSPGVPPDDLNPSERAYYSKRWDEFTGYYRDPSAFFTVHLMILSELEIYTLGSKMSAAKETSAYDKLVKKKAEAIRTLKDLKAQLPDKEAQEQTDDEKSLSVIHQKYIEEKKLRSPGNITRFLTTEAECLGPNLVFSFSAERIRELLKRCGFRIVEADDAIARYNVDSINGMSIDEFMQYLGFRLNEKYAMSGDESNEIIEGDTGEDTTEMNESFEAIDLSISPDATDDGSTQEPTIG